MVGADLARECEGEKGVALTVERGGMPARWPGCGSLVFKVNVVVDGIRAGDGPHSASAIAGVLCSVGGKGGSLVEECPEGRVKGA